MRLRRAIAVLLSGVFALAMPWAAGHAAEDKFLEFLEYLGSWDESDAEWEQFIDDSEPEVDAHFGTPYGPDEPGDRSEEEDVVS